MNPITNFEKWINSIATGEAPDITPATRLEHFLNKIRQAIVRKSDVQGGGIFRVHLTQSNGDFVVAETFAEIDAAISAGKTIVISFYDDTTIDVYPSSVQFATGIGFEIIYRSLTPTEESGVTTLGINEMKLVGRPNDDVTVTANNYTITSASVASK